MVVITVITTETGVVMGWVRYGLGSIIVMHGALIYKQCKQGRIGCPAGAGQRFMNELREE